MNGKLSIIISVILATAAILTVQSSSSMLQISYAQSLSFQSCPDGSTPDASGNCPTLPPPAGDGETAAPPATETPPPTAAPPATETPPPTAAPPAGASQGATNTGSAYNYSGMSAEWANSILAVHNSERAAVGVPPLVWSDGLADVARVWAEHLATIGELVHTTDAEKECNCNENLAGFKWDEGPTAPGGGTSLWVNEKQNWHGGVLTEENWYPTGHYTQMVWRDTTDVGCGAAPPGAGGLPYSILVCVYYPPGNYIGRAPY